MFSGIVQGMAEVLEIEQREQFRTHRVRLPTGMRAGLESGASVAHNGCCLTVTSVAGDGVAFDLMQETLAVTNLGQLKVGDGVNVERAARFGDEIGGHAMSGHIIDTAEVVEVLKTVDNCQLRFRLAEPLMRYLFTKGYIGIDGISLTIGEVQGDEFTVNLIPETLNRTNIGGRVVGERVNIEIDPQTQAIVDTVERVIGERDS